MKYGRGRQSLEQPAPGRARRGPPATEWGEGVPASGRRGFGAQPQVNEAVPAASRRGFGAQPQVDEAATDNRFATCRWRANPDNGGSPHCTHRDVLPYAGTNGFNPESWCPDCTFFKMRRGARQQARFAADDL